MISPLVEHHTQDIRTGLCELFHGPLGDVTPDFFGFDDQQYAVQPACQRVARAQFIGHREIEDNQPELVLEGV
jgi:hypothetical protein